MPIIGVTAHVGPDERHRLIEGGMDDHLTKPFTPSDLAAALSRAVPDEAPAAAPPDDVFEALLDLPGLAGARAAIGSLAIAPIELRTMLMEFLAGERGAPDAMREDLAAGRRDAARRRAHGIKGGAAMVGATRLEASARALDDALRGEPAPVDTEPLLAMLAAEVDALLADLRRHAERHPAERHPAERHPAERHPAERHPAERPS
ncbi:MAG: Hpt domain-containing protein [Myxococcota bacterium]